MLLTLMSNLGMFGSITPPTPVNPGTGGGGGYTGGTYYEEDFEKREKGRKKKILDEEEFIIEFLKRATNIINNQ